MTQTQQDILLEGRREAFQIPDQIPMKNLEVLSVIPKHCLEKDLLRSLYYTFLSLSFVLITGALGYLFLPYPSFHPLSLTLWSLYAVLNGTIATGLWVIAHECGHDAYSNNKLLQDTVGYIFHSFLLVPYFAWQRSHVLHHAYTNHTSKGETHVPHKANSTDGKRQLKMFHWMGEGPFAILNLVLHLLVGWPAYLMFGATGGSHRGKSNHFIPNNDKLFPKKIKPKVWWSDLGIVLTLLGLYLASWIVGWSYILALYVGPYLIVNMWLVLYTWLQHTDVDVPHYDEDEWTWLRGAFATVDRPYPKVIDFLHHRIGSTHVLHHICPKVPHYHAREATRAIKEALPNHYLYDPSTITSALWRVARKCIVIDKQDNSWLYTQSLRSSQKPKVKSPKYCEHFNREGNQPGESDPKE